MILFEKNIIFFNNNNINHTIIINFRLFKYNNKIRLIGFFLEWFISRNFSNLSDNFFMEEGGER